jgi:hypothetical protein
MRPPYDDRIALPRSEAIRQCETVRPLVRQHDADLVQHRVAEQHVVRAHAFLNVIVVREVVHEGFQTQRVEIYPCTEVEKMCGRNPCDVGRVNEDAAAPAIIEPCEQSYSSLKVPRTTGDTAHETFGVRSS